MMMKRILPSMLLIAIGVCPSLAGLANEDDAADGYLTMGEYDTSIKLEGSDKLIINGGGSAVIDAWDYSCIEIYSTSLPLKLYEGGVYDIHLNDNSTLLFSGGATQSLKVYKNASALLTGGTINYITIYHYGTMTSKVTIDCQDGWEWLYTSGKISGIRGLWDDGTAFQIAFSNPGSIFPDTYNFVHVIPEPATLTLLSVGGLLLRKRKQ
jgi:hypothetical protein